MKALESVLLFLLALSVTTSSAFVAVNKDSGTSRKCDTITVPLCAGIGYTLTSMPNQFNHAKQEDAGLVIANFASLIHVNCSSELRFLLCSMYTPICIPDYARPIPACRAVCERVRAKCLPFMEPYGFSWPEQMSCHLLPAESKDDQLCMDPLQEKMMQEQKKMDGENERRKFGKTIELPYSGTSTKRGGHGGI
jgi:hypothetical protein